MAADDSNDDNGASERTEGESGEPLQQYLNEAALSYLARCEPLPSPPTDCAEVVWMVGLPGAGKTKTAESLPGRERIGIDDIRTELRIEFGDAGWVDAAYEAALERVQTQVAEGRSVVFDSTGLHSDARQRVLDLGDRDGCAVRALWVDTPIAACRERQTAKGRRPNNPFFTSCISLLLQALRVDLLEEPFASYHYRRGNGAPSSVPAAPTT